MALAVGDGQDLDGFDLGHTAEIMYGKQADAVLAAIYRAGTLDNDTGAAESLGAISVRTHGERGTQEAALYALREAGRQVREYADTCPDYPDPTP